MERARFDDYIRRFNAQDATAFDDYIHPELRMQNGGMVFHGVQGMKDHYRWIWRSFRETLDVQRFVSDDESLAVEMQTHFEALRDDADTPFGSVVAGEQFDYHGVIMYRMRDGLFGDIRVAYLSFSHTALDGTVTQMGLAH
mgnify:CR=1 FL=1